MKYIKLNIYIIRKIKEFRNISLEFWQINEVKYFYNKKEYKMYKKYVNLLKNRHMI